MVEKQTETNLKEKNGKSLSLLEPFNLNNLSKEEIEIFKSQLDITDSKGSQ